MVARTAPRYLPLRFEANRGQWDPHVHFVTRDRGATLLLSDDSMHVVLTAPTGIVHADATRAEQLREQRDAIASAPMAAVTMKLVGAAPVQPIGETELVTKSNFFIGKDSAKWRTNVPNFARVRARNLLPGVDMVWYGGPSGIEYDIEVARGVDASRLAFDVKGADALSIRDDGALVVTTAAGMLVEPPPHVSQDGRVLRSRFVVRTPEQIGFSFDDYDSTRPLLIDPVLLYSTYVGGSSDDSVGVYTSGLIGQNEMAVDSGGNVLLAGITTSSNFPVTSGAVQTTFGGNANADACVVKLAADGLSLAYATYLGGGNNDHAAGITLDSSGNAYVIGVTLSTDFPVTSGAYRTALSGISDAFIAKIDASGSLLDYSTYLGGNAVEQGLAITLDASANAFVTGMTTSTNFPTTTGAYQTSGGLTQDIFVATLNATGSALTFGTYLGGNANDEPGGIALDSAGNIFVAGTTQSTNFPTTTGAYQTSGGGTNPDAFVTKLASGGSALSYSTYLGGTKSDYGAGLAIDAFGYAYVTGWASVGFPTTSGACQTTFGGPPSGFDAFITKVSTAGTSLVYSTYLGGSYNDEGVAIAVDASGNAWVAGEAWSTNFPTTSNAQQTTGGGVTYADAFLTELKSTGNALVYSTYLGGNTDNDRAFGVALDANGGIYMSGFTSSTNFPTLHGYQTANAGLADLFIAKFGPPLVINPTSASVSPKGSVTFTASGGYGTYTFSLLVNASGGSIGATSGVYTAGATGNVGDIVKVTDTGGSVATSSVTVTAAVSINPSAPTAAPHGNVSFVASGGSGTGYSWSLTTNNSGATINASTGVYTAGATPSVSDVVSVVDSLGNTKTATVKVGPGVSIAPASPSTPPKGAINFVATGGSGTNYAWSLTTNNSGGSINASTGAYVAGGTGGTLDLVAVSDSLGNAASVAINVGAGITVTPATTTSPPKGAVSFSATGGSSTGYAWSFLANNSGATINASTGAYTAGATPSVSDTVKVTDSLGNVGSATVTVGAGVSMSPLAPSTPPKGAVAFGATGGSGTGFSWSISTNASGATINASTGAYVAGATGSVSDVVKVTDSLGNTTTTTVSVGAAISISPSVPSAPPKGTILFGAVGGSGAGYVWSITTNKSGGTINASTGSYTAGATGNVADTVAVTDSLGNTSAVNVSVGGGLAINPASPTTPPQGAITFSAQGGSGTGWTWALKTNASGGSIDATSGAYIAGATGNVSDVVGVTDSLGNTAAVNVTVGAGVAITPTKVNVAAGASTSFSAAGGSGKGYQWSLSTNNSGGSITSSGSYTAGATSDVTDDIKLVDSLGNAATATVTVIAPIVDAGSDDAAATDAPATENDAGVGPPTSSGCGCEAAGSSSRFDATFAMLGLLTVTTARRFRRKRERASSASRS